MIIFSELVSLLPLISERHLTGIRDMDSVLHTMSHTVKVLTLVYISIYCSSWLLSPWLSQIPTMVSKNNDWVWEVQIHNTGFCASIRWWCCWTGKILTIWKRNVVGGLGDTGSKNFNDNYTCGLSMCPSVHNLMPSAPSLELPWKRKFHNFGYLIFIWRKDTCHFQF